MVIKGNFGLRLAFIACLMISGLNVSAQWNFSNNPLSILNQIVQADTSDYLPYYVPHALELNLMIAASKGNVPEIKRLINKGADVNTATLEGATPLIFAVTGNKREAVRELLTHEPELDYMTNNNETPLLIAVKSGFFEIAELLIRAGADINVKDKYGATPLHYASVYGLTDMADLLLYYDAEINTVADDGTTPLLAAVWSGEARTADLLVQNGADTEAEDNKGFTPLILAASTGDTLMMNILLKGGADLYGRNASGHNALTISIASGNLAAERFLLYKGKGWQNTENKSFDPYKVAALYRRHDAIALLKESGLEGTVKYNIDQLSVVAGSRFNRKDYYTSFQLTFREPYLGLGLTTGIDAKIWRTRVFEEKSDVILYQYRHRDYLAYAGISKEFKLTDSFSGWNTAFTASLAAGYVFGNSLTGTRDVPADRFVVVPRAGISATKINLSVEAGLEYLKTPFYLDGPLWIRIGLSYNYYFEKTRIQAKNIRWY